MDEELAQCGGRRPSEADGDIPVEELGFDPADPDVPVVVWDGECGFCRRSLEYLLDRVGDEVEAVPYQHVHRHFDDVDRADFETAVHLVEPGGVVTRGAEAVFRCLQRASDGGIGRWAYDHLPGFAAISERGYRFVAEHRPLVDRLTRLLIGEDLRRSRYGWARWLFMRILGLALVVAFASLGVQVLGLFGTEGIVPATEALEQHRMRAERGNWSAAYRLWRVPTLFWWVAPTDGVLTTTCTVGGLLSVAVVAGVWPRLLLPLSWATYLSLCTLGGPFLGYQWDALLLESTALGWLIAPAGFWTLRRAPPVGRAVRWAFWWLAFRLMWMSGLAKILSGDPTWRDMSALTYHFWTQPLPTCTAYWVHQLPDGVLAIGTGAALVIELAVPFLVFGPRRARRLAAYAFVVLQGAIAVTGNYTFFNVLTAGVCLLLLDDRIWRSVLPDALLNWGVEKRASRATAWRQTRGWVVAVVSVCTIVGTAVQMDRRFSSPNEWSPLNVPASAAETFPPLWVLRGPQQFVAGAMEDLRQFRTLNNYGLFADMTTERPELIIQASRDGTDWKSYEFRWKPDDLDERPRFVEPHQPRLDWQMWFQALRLERAHEQTGRCRPSPWFLQFQQRLLEGSGSVRGLLDDVPFPDSTPNYVRVVVFDYRFTSPSDETGDWWRREHRRRYCPPLTLRDGQLQPTRGGRTSPRR